MLIAVMNNSSMISDTDVQFMVKAVKIQLRLHAAPAWNQLAPEVKFYAKDQTVPNYAWTVSILDNPDVANALGYHIENADKINAFVFCQPVLDNGGVVLYDPSNPQNVSVASVCSHEILECFMDRYCGTFCDGPDTTSKHPKMISYCQELCDPVEGDLYAIDVDGTSVSVSNFIFPSWFNPNAVVPDNMPFDYLKKLSAPFTMTAGGYLIVRDHGPGSERQVFGEQMPEWKKTMKRNAFSRMMKRTK